jgi:hypothetical protein
LVGEGEREISESEKEKKSTNCRFIGGREGGIEEGR